MSAILRKTATLSAAAVGLLLLISVGQSLGLEPTTTPRTSFPRRIAPPQTAQLAESAHRFVGVASCAASNCHGGEVSHGPKGSEYTQWTSHDHHAQAYTVLFNDRSVRIAKALGLEAAHTAKVCLDCHTMNSNPAHAVPGHRFAIDDGVSCESCHGAAEHWLGAHVQYTWKLKTLPEKEAYGFVDTSDMLSRARMCADCHVGSPKRQVNHDLIAAGHPRLNFELAAFQANMPTHWDVKKERDRHLVGPDGRSDYEAKLWAIGQVVTAEVSVKLLAARTADETPIWPEFTEYGCYACHHDLASPSWRQSRGYAGRKPVSYPWGTWQFALLPTIYGDLTRDGTLAENSMVQKLTGDGTPFSNLRNLMNHPLPPRAEVHAEAVKLAAQLSARADQVNQLSYSAEEIRKMLLKITEAGPELGQQDWDTAAQVYLATSALHLGYREAKSGLVRSVTPDELDVRDRLKTIRVSLGFPQGFDSPETLTENPGDLLKPLSQIHAELKAE